MRFDTTERSNCRVLLRDPIWGEIYLSEVEHRIIKTHIFQRLRNIKQLSFVYLSYPSASHTRFEHSIGTMHATDELLQMLDTSASGIADSIGLAQDRQILRLAALLHDIGHPPFSHAIEHLFALHPDLIKGISRDTLSDEFSTFLADRRIPLEHLGRHEVFTEFIILHNAEIQSAIRDWIKQDTGDPDNVVEEKFRNTIQVIAKLAVGELPEGNVLSDALKKSARLFKSIVSGDLDADKIDYLMRDNYYCGLPYKLDISFLRNKLIITDDGLKIKQSGLSFMENLLLTRYRLAKEVHQDMWNVFATGIVTEVLYERLHNERNGKLIVDIYTKWTDAQLVQYVSERHGSALSDTVSTVITTQFPLQEIARISFDELHPSIRECMEVLSEAKNYYHMHEIAEKFRLLFGAERIVIDFCGVKPAEFSMALVEGGDLLDDLVIRGIATESILSSGVVVYGDFAASETVRHASKDEIATRATSSGTELPCDTCGYSRDCVDALGSLGKIVLAQLLVGGYRDVVRTAEKDITGGDIVGIDLIMTVLDKICTYISTRVGYDYPTRQELYRIVHAVSNSRTGIDVIGKVVDVEPAQITGSFHLELRKCEQMGLLFSERKVVRSGDGSSTKYNFDRRYRVSDYGTARLNKLRAMKDRGITIFDQYIQTMDFICQLMDHYLFPTIQDYLSKPNQVQQFKTYGCGITEDRERIVPPTTDDTARGTCV